MEEISEKIIEKGKKSFISVALISLFGLPVYNCGPEENKNVINDPVCISCAEPSESCNLDDKYCYANEECLCVNTEEYGYVGVCVEEDYLPKLEKNPDTLFTCYNLVKRNLDW